jgi:hypothetical protein
MVTRIKMEIFQKIEITAKYRKRPPPKVVMAPPTIEIPSASRLSYILSFLFSAVE